MVYGNIKFYYREAEYKQQIQQLKGEVAYLEDERRKNCDVIALQNEKV